MMHVCHERVFMYIFQTVLKLKTKGNDSINSAHVIFEPSTLKLLRESRFPRLLGMETNRFRLLQAKIGTICANECLAHSLCHGS